MQGTASAVTGRAAWDLEPLGRVSLLAGFMRDPCPLGAPGEGTSLPGSNVCAPVSISNTTHPNAQMSVRLSTGFPRACSGLMYAAVPRITPA